MLFVIENHMYLLLIWQVDFIDGNKLFFGY